MKFDEKLDHIQGKCQQNQLIGFLKIEKKNALFLFQISLPKYISSCNQKQISLPKWHFHIYIYISLWWYDTFDCFVVFLIIKKVIIYDFFLKTIIYEIILAYNEVHKILFIEESGFGGFCALLVGMQGCLLYIFKMWNTQIYLYLVFTLQKYFKLFWNY